MKFVKRIGRELKLLYVFARSSSPFWFQFFCVASLSSVFIVAGWIVFKNTLLPQIKHDIPLFYAFITTNKLDSQSLWYNIRDVLLVIGYFIVVIAFVINVSNRRKDLKNKKFDTTVEAIRYFNEYVQPALKKSTKVYKDTFGDETTETDSSSTNEEKGAVYHATITAVFEDGEYSDSFVKLNLLSSYTFYKTINKKQFLSSAADEVHHFSSVLHFEDLEKELSNNYYMNNYKNFIVTVENYIEERKIIYGNEESDPPPRGRTSRKGKARSKHRL